MPIDKKYNKKYTWEYNLIQFVRWNSEDAKDDVIFFIKKYIKYIIKDLFENKIKKLLNKV